ncbi:hypothetical protein PWT90_05597 [Aphanocladium album]|nr:hypothetical protein PWT90_05597 [Aphanocladium album]
MNFWTQSAGKITTKWKRRTGSARHESAVAAPPSTRTPSEASESSEASCINFPLGIHVFCDAPDSPMDICFIHGLAGNRESTWTRKGAGAPWPQLLLALALNARLLSYGYNAYFMESTASPSVNRLTDHAKNFLLDLTNHRVANNRRSVPLIVVAHSMGGLVCKQAVLLSQADTRSHLHDMFASLRGIIFMGTPHRGSWMANWASIPALALGVFRPVNKSLLGLLETDNEQLEALQEQFLTMLRHQLERGRCIEIMCFFEELPTKRLGVIVPKESAILEGYEYSSIYATHAGMAKFASVEDSGYERVYHELLRWHEAITTASKPEPRSKPAAESQPDTQPEPTAESRPETQPQTRPEKQSRPGLQPGQTPAPRPRRRRRASQKATKVSGMVAGDDARMVVNGANVDATNFKAGHRAVFVFGENADKVLAVLPESSTPHWCEEDEDSSAQDTVDSEEGEVIMVSSSVGGTRTCN